MKITIAQTDIAFGKKSTNLDKALNVVKEASSDLVLFPELFTTGFDFENIRALSEKVPGGTTDALCEACGDSMVGGSILEDDNDIYNTFFIASKNGVLGKYRKMHLFKEEKDFFMPGKDTTTIDTKFGTVGLATCYDIRFPELFRKLVKEGSEIILVSAEFPKPRAEHWRVLLQARAIENQVFMIATNRVGHDKKREYFGKSMIIDPWGSILIEGGASSEIMSCEIDVSLISKVREDFPVLGDSKII
jgi:predicted amidohydrolase